MSVDMLRVYPSCVAVLCVSMLSWTGDAAGEKADETNRLVLGLGRLEILDSERTGYGSVEYRGAGRFGGWETGPWLSLETSGREHYAGTGVFLDVSMGEKWVLTPSLGVGLYLEDEGIDLGSSIEFRSAIEVSYRLPHGARVGVSFGHMSNAFLGSHNPGTEFLKLQLSMPVGLKR